MVAVADSFVVVIVVLVLVLVVVAVVVLAVVVGVVLFPVECPMSLDQSVADWLTYLGLVVPTSGTFPGAVAPIY